MEQIRLASAPHTCVQICRVFAGACGVFIDLRHVLGSTTAEVQEQAALDPSSVNKCNLPALIGEDPARRARFMARMAVVAAEAFRRVWGSGTDV